MKTKMDPIRHDHRHPVSHIIGEDGESIVVGGGGGDEGGEAGGAANLYYLPYEIPADQEEEWDQVPTYETLIVELLPGEMAEVYGFDGQGTYVMQFRLYDAEGKLMDVQGGLTGYRSRWWVSADGTIGWQDGEMSDSPYTSLLTGHEERPIARAGVAIYYGSYTGQGSPAYNGNLFYTKQSGVDIVAADPITLP